jgi:hypothetical protein
MMKPFPTTLKEAALEYFWMLSRGYPQKASLKLVGDKFNLNGEFRQVLYRGVAADKPAQSRRSKIGTVSPGDLVLIDTYNVLFTVNNYLLGKHLFMSNDGLIRDAGEMRGRIVNKPQFVRSVSLMLEVLQQWPGVSCIHYLDEPVSYSGELSRELSQEMTKMGIKGECHLHKNPDRMLILQDSDAICSSDSAIIDQYQGKVIDLPRALLESNFQADFPVLIQDPPANRARS